MARIVKFERLTSKSALAWGAGTVLVVLVMSAVPAVTQPENRVYTLFGPLLVGGFVVAILRARSWLEVDPAVLVQRRLLFTARVPLREARAVGLRANGGGGVQLVARTGRVRGVAVAPVLAITTYVERSQAPPVLDAAREILAAAPAPGASEVARALAEQAAYLRSGGDARSSPLAERARDAAAGIAAGSGIAVIIGHL